MIKTNCGFLDNSRTSMDSDSVSLLELYTSRIFDSVKVSPIIFSHGPSRANTCHYFEGDIYVLMIPRIWGL